MKENKIQSECFLWYWNNYCLKNKKPRGFMFSVPNELAGSNKITMMQAKAMGLVSGVSDTIILLPNGKIIFCEFKDEKGKQSERQKEFELIVTNLGFDYILVRSLDQFKKEIYEKTTNKL